MKILIIEDEIKLAQALKSILESEGYQASAIYDGQTGYQRGRELKDDLVLLDLNLPGKDGVSICTQWRQEGVNTPVIMLTARDTTDDRILGLDAGADDYLVKPFETNELLARIRALMRRQKPPDALIEVGNLKINLQTEIVTRGGVEVNLSATEYELLKYLGEHLDQVVAKDEVHKAVWHKPWNGKSKVVDVYVGYLRQKVDRNFPKENPLIHTIKGRGYRLGEIYE